MPTKSPIKGLFFLCIKTIEVISPRNLDYNFDLKLQLYTYKAVDIWLSLWR